METSSCVVYFQEVIALSMLEEPALHSAVLHSYLVRSRFRSFAMLVVLSISV